MDDFVGFHVIDDHLHPPPEHHSRILYFSEGGTALTTMRPSYEAEAKRKGSAADHATA